MSCCGEGGNCAPLEAVVSIDERGQLVLPKDLRDKWGLKGGDKLAVISCCIKEGEMGCATLVKADLLTKMKLKIDIDWTAEEE